MDTKLLVLALLLSAGCGNSVTGPSDVPGATPGWPSNQFLEIIGGDTGQYVEAFIFVNGAPYTGEPQAAGVPVDITAPGYLHRETLVRAGETTFVLWPDSPALPAAYTAALVYTGTRGQGLEPMLRVSEHTVRVTPSAALRNDPVAMEAILSALQRINEAAPSITYQLGNSGPVTLDVNPRDPDCVGLTGGLTYWTLSGHTIVNSRIVFCSVETSRIASVVAHELGHSLGLRHSISPGDLMASPHDRNVGSFSQSEKLTLALMYQRRPGNIFPDNDRATGISASTLRTVLVKD